MSKVDPRSPPSSRSAKPAFPVLPFKPQLKLLILLGIVTAMWIAALVAMCFLTVHKS